MARRILVLILCTSGAVVCARLANETEFLAISALQAASLPSMKGVISADIEKNFRFRAVPKLFDQQNDVYPESGSLQLPSFGALKPWSEILSELSGRPDRKLLIMIRHGQAWENLNPLSNSECEFELNGEIIQNFDSPLSPTGFEQASSLNSLFKSYSDESANKSTWFETIGLSGKAFYSSPLSRTMQTSQYVLNSLPVPDVTVTEIMRASIGTDVCNYRHSVTSPTNGSPLSAPWSSGCSTIPSDSLISIYGDPSVVGLKFLFPIRPPGGSGLGLFSDYDELWRSDVVDDSHINRSRAFIEQLYALDSVEAVDGSVVGLVTHGEMVEAVYEALGEVAYGPVNTEVVPIMIERY